MVAAMRIPLLAWILWNTVSPSPQAMEPNTTFLMYKEY